MRASITLALLLAVTSPRNLSAQDASGWVGTRVILQFGSVLRVGNQVVDNQELVANSRGGQRNTFRIYKVELVNGPWIWLQAEKEGIAGWIPAAEVIRYDQAIEYFTNQIRANAASDQAYTSRGHIWKDRRPSGSRRFPTAGPTPPEPPGPRRSSHRTTCSPFSGPSKPRDTIHDSEEKRSAAKQVGDRSRRYSLPSFLGTTSCRSIVSPGPSFRPLAIKPPSWEPFERIRKSYGWLGIRPSARKRPSVPTWA